MSSILDKNYLKSNHGLLSLFVVFRPTREFFTHGDVTITGEGLQILTYARHSSAIEQLRFFNCHITTVTLGIRL